jgi:hypothetical protein
MDDLGYFVFDEFEETLYSKNKRDFGFVTNMGNSERSLIERAIRITGKCRIVENATTSNAHPLENHFALYSDHSDLTNFWRVYEQLKKEGEK